MFKKRLFGYLLDLGLTKKRYSDGYYYFGLERKEQKSPTITELISKRDDETTSWKPEKPYSLENPVKSVTKRDLSTQELQNDNDIHIVSLAELMTQRKKMEDELKESAPTQEKQMDDEKHDGEIPTLSITELITQRNQMDKVYVQRD